MSTWDGDPDLRRLLLGVIRSGNAADTRGMDDEGALSTFGPSAEPFARALRETIRAEVAAATADVSPAPPCHHWRGLPSGRLRDEQTDCGLAMRPGVIFAIGWEYVTCPDCTERTHAADVSPAPPAALPE